MNYPLNFVSLTYCLLNFHAAGGSAHRPPKPNPSESTDSFDCAVTALLSDFQPRPQSDLFCTTWLSFYLQTPNFYPRASFLGAPLLSNSPAIGVTYYPFGTSLVCYWTSPPLTAVNHATITSCFCSLPQMSCLPSSLLISSCRAISCQGGGLISIASSTRRILSPSVQSMLLRHLIAFLRKSTPPLHPLPISHLHTTVTTGKDQATTIPPDILAIAANSMSHCFR